MASWASKSWEPQGMSIGEVTFPPWWPTSWSSPKKKTSKNGSGFKDLLCSPRNSGKWCANLTNILEMGFKPPTRKKVGFGWFGTSVPFFQEHRAWWKIQISPQFEGVCWGQESAYGFDKCPCLIYDSSWGHFPCDLLLGGIEPNFNYPIILGWSFWMSFTPLLGWWTSLWWFTAGFFQVASPAILPNLIIEQWWNPTLFYCGDWWQTFASDLHFLNTPLQNIEPWKSPTLFARSKHFSKPKKFISSSDLGLVPPGGWAHGKGWREVEKTSATTPRKINMSPEKGSC